MVQNSITQQAECLACQWNRHCIEPPSMTTEEVKAKMEEAKDKVKNDEDVGSAMMGSMLDAVLFGGKDREAIVCPIFADALRSGPELSQKIRGIMKGEG